MAAHEVLVDLALIFVAAKLTGALFRRLGQPPVVGELLAGVLIGPHALGLIEVSEATEVLAEIGAILLLFAVGLDTPLSDLKAVGTRSLAVGVGGIVIPFLAGAGLLMVLGNPTNEALFMGTAMVATSVGVTARVLHDLGVVGHPASRVVLGAAVVDDILGLLLLAVVAGAATGQLSAGSVVVLAVLAITFVVLVGGLGPSLVARAEPLLDRLGRRGVFTLALGFCLVLSAIAGVLQLAAIIGAFLAGMAFAETHERYGLEAQVQPVYALLVPFFFVITGAHVDLAVLTDPGTLSLLALVTVVAIVGKLIGGGLAALPMGRRNAAIVGTGMVPRGEVGILVASIGLAQGVIENDLYAVVVGMSILTTLVAPPVLKALFGGSAAEERDHQRTPEIEGLD